MADTNARYEATNFFTTSTSCCRDSTLRSAAKRLTLHPIASVFEIATTDYAASILIPALVERVARGARGAGVEIAQWNDSVSERMESGRIHLAIIGSDNLQPFDLEPLFTDEFVCVVAKEHPLRGGCVTERRATMDRRAARGPRLSADRRISHALPALRRRRRVTKHDDLHDGSPLGEPTRVSTMLGCKPKP